MKRYIIIILLFVLLIGCENNKEISNSEVSVISDEVTKFVVFEEYLDVSSSVERYQLTMSSVPGLPLDLKVLKDDVAYTIDLSVSAGHFLSWKGGAVEQLGDRVYLDFTDATVYWSPLEDVIIESADVVIEVKQDDETIAKTEYQIVLADDGYILMRTVLTNE